MGSQRKLKRRLSSIFFSCTSFREPSPFSFCLKELCLLFLFSLFLFSFISVFNKRGIHPSLCKRYIHLKLTEGYPILTPAAHHCSSFHSSSECNNEMTGSGVQYFVSLQLFLLLSLSISLLALIHFCFKFSVCHMYMC